MTQKNVWIIGASSGIGEALARYYNSKNYQIAISARRKEKLQEIASSFQKIPLVLPLDVQKRSDFIQAYRTIRSHLPHLDQIIYCAGLYTKEDATSFKMSTTRKVFDINLKGAFYLIDTILPFLATYKVHSLAMTGSISGYRGLPKAFSYRVAKASLIHFLETLKIELKPYQIKVQVINPSYVDTEMAEHSKKYRPNAISANTAAVKIAQGLQGKSFEITVRNPVTWLAKFLQILPYSLYFPLMRLMLKLK